MLAWIKALLADPNGLPDEMRVMFVVTHAAYLGFWVWWLYAGHPWDAMTFCGGIASIVTTFGASLRIRGSN